MNPADLTARNDDLRRFFAERVATYDDVHTPFIPTKNALTERLPEGTRRVLDLGAGTGLELIALFDRFPDAAVTAVDLSEEMLAQLRARPFADRVTCICGSFFDADLGEGYDAVISTSALHHFTPAQKVDLYTRVRACLRPGGLFLNSDYIAETDAEEAMLADRLRDNDGSYAHVDTPLTIPHECEALRNADFARIAVAPVERESYRLFVASRD